LLQVHDELIYEVENKKADEAADLIKRVMEQAVESRLPLSADLSVGDNWGELL
jgi:DNA polymerase-1